MLTLDAIKPGFLHSFLTCRQCTQADWRRWPDGSRVSPPQRPSLPPCVSGRRCPAVRPPCLLESVQAHRGVCPRLVCRALVVMEAQVRQGSPSRGEDRKTERPKERRV